MKRCDKNFLAKQWVLSGFRSCSSGDTSYSPTQEFLLIYSQKATFSFFNPDEIDNRLSSQGVGFERTPNSMGLYKN